MGGNKLNGPGGRVLLILLLAYIFNFIDRQIIGVLALPIKAEFGLSDTALGRSAASPSRIFYAAHRHADRAGSPTAASRVAIIAASIGLWSLFTACAASRRATPSCSLARMGVGIGEAGGVAPSYALIADFYPAGAARRARSPSSRSASRSARRSASSSAAGSPAHLSWRAAFLIVGARRPADRPAGRFC